MPNQIPRYVIISPVRNEGKFLPDTITSVTSQKVLPQEWIIVDDGSDDNSPDVLRAASAQYPFIRILTRTDRGFRKSGTGVMEAFYDGYDLLKCTDWDYLVKLDGDLRFGTDYFSIIFEAFAKDPKLGIAGGEVLFSFNGKNEIESKDPNFHVRGATKVYRRECWDGIGGLIRTSGWDTVDEVKANMLGWNTRRIKEATLLHLRPTGGADGTWKNAVKNGRGSYLSGYHPLFLVAKCGLRLTRGLNIKEPVGLFYGYFKSYLEGQPRIAEGEVLNYMQKQQLNRLLCRKSMWR